MRTAIVTGSSGLVGSATVTLLEEQGYRVVGVDNDSRADFFGPDGSTGANGALDIRDRAGIRELVFDSQPDLIVHCAAQPAHELGTRRPFENWDVNATGTINLLEACRWAAPEAPFIYLSSSKVYGDSVNRYPFGETDQRYVGPSISESYPLDASTHGLYGASKVAADVMVQEYGRYFGMPTVVLRPNCMTGPAHAAVEDHGFLAYLARCFREDRTYRIFGYKGKQVRDQLHAADVASAILHAAQAPEPGSVFNIGGGRANSISVLEAIGRLEHRFGRPLRTEYVDEPRKGDHIHYVTDDRRFRRKHPGWEISYPLDAILDSLTKPLLLLTNG
jgi:CDP-paratose 2-epimerase